MPVVGPLNDDHSPNVGTTSKFSQCPFTHQRDQAIYRQTSGLGDEVEVMVGVKQGCAGLRCR